VLQHQQQVATAVERAKQVTMTELNAIIGVSTSSDHSKRNNFLGLCKYHIQNDVLCFSTHSNNFILHLEEHFPTLSLKVEALASVP
jgi:hypothetical protein